MPCPRLTFTINSITIAAQLNGVSRDAGLRGASRAQPALPDPDHTGGGNFDLLTILRREDGFPLNPRPKGEGRVNAHATHHYLRQWRNTPA